VISPVLRRSSPLIVRRDDPQRSGRRSRRARRRFCLGTPTRFGAIAGSVLVVASVAWLFVFACLLTIIN
jgi:hypothetical protein